MDTCHDRGERQSKRKAQRQRAVAATVMRTYVQRLLEQTHREPAAIEHQIFTPLPLELASPYGKAADLDMSNRRGVSAPLAETTSALARWKIFRPWPSR
jgi:hypothetical protein